MPFLCGEVGIQVVLRYRSGRIAAQGRRSDKILVEGVGFSLDEGESLALIGETGSGKTMIAQSIMGLLPRNVKMTGGEVLLDGQALSTGRQARGRLGVEVAYIPQSGLEFLDPSRRVRLHLYDSLKKAGTSAAALERTALEKLSAAGFHRPEEVLDRYPFQLSGGMAQRVTIALAACAKARLIIADEPTNGLDAAATAGFFKTLDALFPGAARLIITHDIAVAELCGGVLVLCGGRMMERGPSAQVLDSPRHPYTRALMGALVKNGMGESPVLRSGVRACPFYRRCPSAGAACGAGREHRIDGQVEWWCDGAV